jgi:APA family basic amino acid/polyamine antiporter
VLSILFVISALGAMNGSVMTAARVPFAMAEDGLFFKGPEPRFISNPRVPVVSVVVQGVVACIFAASGKFDQLTNYVVFSSWIFYALVTASIFKFRKKTSEPRRLPRLGLPVDANCIYHCGHVSTDQHNLHKPNRDSIIGLGVIAAGIPFYFLFKHSQKT